MPLSVEPESTKELLNRVPRTVRTVMETLEAAGFEAYLVGGCVRDLYLSKRPKD